MKKGLWLCCLAFGHGCVAQTDEHSTARSLSAENARDYAISYSPDGSRAAWWAISDSTSAWQLWVGDSLLAHARKLGVVSFHQGLPPVWSPDGKRIAAVSSDSSFADVVVVPADSGTVRWLTNGPAPEAPIQWHPDGDRLMYVRSSSDGVFTSAVLTISSGTSTPTVPSEPLPVFGLWSPDGTKLVYSRYAGSNVTLWVADDHGANPRQLTKEGFEALTFGTAIVTNMWSPDGSAIVYESRRTGTTDIWTVGIDSGAPRQLTRDLRNDIGPAWSPDGKWVVFVSDRGKQTDLWAVPAAGGTDIRITDTRDIEENPYWRPHSSTLVYTTTQNRRSIWSYSLTDSTERQITPDSIVTPFFNVSLHGKIDYVVARGGNVNDLVVADLDGRNARTLFSGVGSIMSPYWSPDGSKITFASDRAGSPDVWVVDVASGALRQLTSWPGYETMATWKRDGSAIYFLSDHDTRQGDVWSVPVGGGEPRRVTTNGSAGVVGSGPPGVCKTNCTEVFVGLISTREGELGISRLLSDGSLRRIPGAESALGLAVAPEDDMVAVPIVTPGGAVTRLLWLKENTPPRTILAPRDMPTMFSYDGKLLSFLTYAGGTADVGVVDLASNRVRRITRTPEDESGSEFTTDNGTLVFSRGRTVQRFFATAITEARR